jgi:hypothetical protein
MKATSVVLILSVIVALTQVTALPLPPQDPGLIPRSLGQDIGHIGSGAESLLAPISLSKRQNIGLISGEDKGLIGLLEGDSHQDGNIGSTLSHAVSSANDRVGDTITQTGDLIAKNNILDNLLANVA